MSGNQTEDSLPVTSLAPVAAAGSCMAINAVASLLDSEILGGPLIMEHRVDSEILDDKPKFGPVPAQRYKLRHCRCAACSRRWKFRLILLRSERADYNAPLGTWCTVVIVIVAGFIFRHSRTRPARLSVYCRSSIR